MFLYSAQQKIVKTMSFHLVANIYCLEITVKSFQIKVIFAFEVKVWSCVFHISVVYKDTKYAWYTILNC